MNHTVIFLWVLLSATAYTTRGQTEGDLQLVGGGHRCEGRLQVFRRRKWGTVCDDNWDINDARVVCRQLGCGSAISAVGNARFGQGSGDIFLDDVACTGTELSLQHCSHRGWGQHNCNHGEDAGVICTGGGDLKLINGRHSCEGRLQVFHSGRWGTVCDDGWDINGARVVCRQLGCGNALSAVGNAHFGQGSGDIFLDDVSCTGSELRLQHCSHRGWGQHNCNHREDAGVVCSANLADAENELISSAMEETTGIVETSTLPPPPTEYVPLGTLGLELTAAATTIMVESSVPIRTTLGDAENEHTSSAMQETTGIVETTTAVTSPKPSTGETLPPPTTASTTGVPLPEPRNASTISTAAYSTTNNLMSSTGETLPPPTAPTSPLPPAANTIPLENSTSIPFQTSPLPPATNTRETLPPPTASIPLENSTSIPFQTSPLPPAANTRGTLPPPTASIPLENSTSIPFQRETLPLPTTRTLSCSGEYMVAHISRTYIVSLGYNEWDLYLNSSDPTCEPQISEAYVIFKIPFSGCGTVRKQKNNNTIIYSNIIKTLVSGYIITRKRNFQFHVTCEMNQNTVVEAEFLAQDSVDIVEKQNGHYNVTLAFYQSPSFFSQVYESPYFVTLNQDLYVQATLHNSDPNLVLFVDTCVASPYADNFVTLTYDLIRSGCTQDSTYSNLYSPMKSEARFQFNSFKFLDHHNEVYLQCKLVVCRADDPFSRCYEGCLTRRKRDVGEPQEKVEAVIGPVMLQEKDKENRRQDLVKTVHPGKDERFIPLAVAAVLLAGMAFALSGFLLSIKLRSNNYHQIY